MSLSRERPGSDLIDLLDRILDKGANVHPSARLRVSENDLRSMRARIVLESVETYLHSPLKCRLSPAEQTGPEQITP